MASDYNAKLIEDLYSTDNEESAIEICDEMVEIGDPIFPRQIFAAYKKFKNSSCSHYFVADLTNFKSQATADIIKEIAHETTRDADISFLLNYLSGIAYFDLEIVDKVFGILSVDIYSNDVTGYDLEIYVDYLEKSEANPDYLKYLLQECFENESLKKDVRKMALNRILRLDSSYIKYCYDNYELFKDKKAEIILVENIVKLNTENALLLKQRIGEFGSERAKEILRQSKLQEDKKAQEGVIKKQKEIESYYATTDVVNEIASIRSSINKISISSDDFGFALFSPTEEIYEQSIPAEDKPKLVGYCMVIRSVIQGFDSRIKDFQIPTEKATILLPEITDFSKSINKFHFLLLDKGLIVDQTIFGLRGLNRLVSKLAHPEEHESQEFFNILKKEGLLELYNNNKWAALHREILLKYRNVLEGIKFAIVASIK